MEETEGRTEVCQGDCEGMATLVTVRQEEFQDRKATWKPNGYHFNKEGMMEISVSNAAAEENKRNLSTDHGV